MSAIKERPILFSGPMVRAILEGRKTVTRRVMKPQPVRNDHGFMRWESKGVLITDQNTAWEPFDERFPEAIRDGLLWLCPYGQPGDRLWVRETTEIDEQSSDSVTLSRYAADHQPVLYSGSEDSLYNGSVAHWIYPRRSRPSIHMPRWACRILLEITDVRVERLQDISGDQAEAEGVDADMCRQFLETSPSRHECKEAVIQGFAGLWASINGDDSWHANPWVWVVEFKRIEQ